MNNLKESVKISAVGVFSLALILYAFLALIPGMISLNYKVIFLLNTNTEFWVFALSASIVLFVLFLCIASSKDTY